MILSVQYQKREVGGELKTIAKNAVKIYQFNEKVIADLPTDLTIEIIQNGK